MLNGATNTMDTHLKLCKKGKKKDMQIQNHSSSQSFRGNLPQELATTLQRHHQGPLPPPPPSHPDDGDAHYPLLHPTDDIHGGERAALKRSREHVLAILSCQIVEGLHPCSFCGMLLMAGEKDYWCCGRGSKHHVPWEPLPDDMNALIRSRGWGAISRIVNSLFSTVVLHSKDPGITYHVGAAACVQDVYEEMPCLRLFLPPRQSCIGILLQGV